jgi:cytochrome c oxidase cbb3-type subunit III
MNGRLQHLAESLGVVVLLQAAAPPPPAPTPAQVQRGQTVFSAQCGFCHGRDAMGGETGPDLTRSAVVAEDIKGDKIGPVVRSGRPEKGMPSNSMSETDLASVVAFIHDQKRKADSLEGNRRTVDVADLQTGNAQAGEKYFNGPGGCSKCHTPTGDLAGLATRLQGLQLMQRMLYPSGRGGRGGRPPYAPTVTVTPPNGPPVTGRLAYRDEFTIALTDESGWYRSWPTKQVKFVVDDKLEAHAAQLPKYTDADMHNVLAYLETLK